MYFGDLPGFYGKSGIEVITHCKKSSRLNGRTFSYAKSIFQCKKTETICAMSVFLIVLMILLLLLIILFFLPFRFHLDLKGDLLDLQVVLHLKLFGIPVFHEEIYYDEKSGWFWGRNSKSKLGKPMAKKATDPMLAVIKALRITRFDYSLYLGGEDVYSTMQLTAILEYLSKFISDFIVKRGSTLINSGVYLNFDFEPGCDLLVRSIFHLSAANIIGNLIEIKLKKGEKRNGIRQSY